MSDLNTLVDFMVTELDEDIVSESYGASRFLNLAEEVSGLQSKRVVELDSPTAGIVSTRGGNKPVSGVNTTPLDLDPVEFAVIVPFHKDFLKLEIEDAAAKVASLAVGAIAKSIDYTIVNGEDENGTAAPAGFLTFKDLVPVTVTTREEFYQAVKSTVANKRSADQIVLTTALWLDLVSATNALGNPVFQIVGDHTVGGSINGIPAVTYESTESFGIIGALRSGAKGGIANGLEIEMLNEATIPWNGGSLNLAVTNHKAIRVSGNAFYGYFNLANFAAITGDSSGS